MANTLIHESRRLLLPFDTVVDALIELEIKHGRWPTETALVEVTMHDGDDDSARSIVLSVRPPRQEALVQRTYTLPIIAAAIVNYCLTMRVPMPRSSTKTIQILPDGIVLQLENTLMLQRRHAEAPPVRVLSPRAGEAPPEAQEADSEALAEAGEETEADSRSDAAAASESLGPVDSPVPSASQA